MQNDGSFLQKFFDSLSHEIPDLQFFYAVTKHVTLDSSWNTKNFPSYGRMTDFTRIYLPLKGEGFGELPSGKTVHFRPYRMYLIPPFCNISLHCDSTLEKYYTHFNAFLPGTDVDIFSSLSTVIEFPVENPLRWKEDFEFLHSVGKSCSPWVQPQGLTALEAKNSLMRILLPVLYHLAESRTAFQEKENRIAQMEYYIEHHLSDKYLIRHLAEELDLNANYLSNYFKAESGMTLHEYIHYRRLYMAIRSLLNEPIQIKALAEQFGYEEVRSFERFFRRMTGFSPLEYKARFRSKVPE